MNLHTASNKELRDWLLTRLGWTFDADQFEYWKYTISPEHGGRTWMACPMPNTLDAANAAMPEGWDWIRTLPEDEPMGWEAFGRVDGKWLSVEVPDTGDKRTDLFRLAALAHQAMDTKGGQ